MNSNEKLTARSLIQIVGVDLAVTLVVIALAILAVRMLKGDDPKDITDAAQVNVFIENPPACFSTTWTYKQTGGGTTKSFPDAGAPLAKGLSQIFLVGIKQNGTMRIDLSLNQIPGCSSAAAVVTAAQNLINNQEIKNFVDRQDKRGGGLFSSFLKDFDDAILASKPSALRKHDKFLESVANLKKHLFAINEHLYWIPSPGTLTLPKPNLAASGYICYRIDRTAELLSLNSSQYTPMYQQFINGNFFKPDMAEHHAIVHDLNSLNDKIGDLSKHANKLLAPQVSQETYKFRQVGLEVNGTYRSARRNFLNGINDIYAGRINGTPLTGDLFNNKHALEDWIAILLAREVQILLDPQTKLQIKVQVMSSGDSKKRSDNQVEQCREFLLQSLIGSTKSIATIRFTRDTATKIDWNQDLRPTECPSRGSP